MSRINPCLRAELDGQLSSAINNILREAARYDGLDIIEANVELTSDLLALLSPVQLAAATAALALRLHRSEGRPS